MRDLHGRTVLLTGASSGIGPYIARRLAEEGARFILSARNEKALKGLAKELGGARVIPADLSRRGEPERLAEEAGGVDVLVANAGVPAPGTLDSFALEEIDRAIDVNLRAPILLARCLMTQMVERGHGHMVFMSSVAGKLPAPGYPLYSATKFGLRGFAHVLRNDLHHTGVGVSVICPTFVSEAGMWAETGMKAHPTVGEVTPDAVAEAVAKAIKGNRAEIVVAPPAGRLSASVGAIRPELAMSVARASGATGMTIRATEKQRHKR
jgi:short-subunit dehydrogenase